MVIAFRRHESPYASFLCNLHEIEPSAEYEITQSYTYDQSKPSIMKGTKLREFEAEIDDCPGSLVIEYRIL